MLIVLTSRYCEPDYTTADTVSRLVVTVGTEPTRTCLWDGSTTWLQSHGSTSILLDRLSIVADLVVAARDHKGLSTTIKVRYYRLDCSYCWIAAACWDLTIQGVAYSCRKGPAPWPTEDGLFLVRPM